MTLQLPDKTYIFEFKVVDIATGDALKQIKTRKYYQKYQTELPVYLIGIEFGKEERNIINWQTETIIPNFPNKKLSL